MTDTLQVNTPFCGDDHDPSSLSVDLAIEKILQTITPLADENYELVSLRQSLDRVLAQAIIAPINVPPHNNSAMDGYALSASDLPENNTKQLNIIGSSLAGHPYLGRCQTGQCVRIMTGAVMPEGTDTVIPQEHVELIANFIRIDSRTKPGDNVRVCGEDLKQGQLVLPKGKRITVADLGLMASLGFVDIKVIRKLRVAFFSTGDELRSIGEGLQVGEIYDSNRYTLYGLLAHQHCQVSDLGVVRDDPEALRKILATTASAHDLIISSGGVSVGDADYVRQVFSELGEMVFWKVAMKPGRPLTFGKIQNAYFLGLPGNPVATMVSFNLFVKPALQKLAGETVSKPFTIKAITTDNLKKRIGRTEYQRGFLTQTADGRFLVSKTGNQSSGILLSMSKANCYIVLSAEQSQIAKGSEVTVQLFSEFGN